MNEDQNTKEYLTPYSLALSELSDKYAIDTYIHKAFGLPDSMGQILIDSPTAVFMEDTLRPKFELNTAKKNELLRIVGGILLGDFYLGNFVSITADRLRIDQQKAKEISNMIIVELFGPVLEDIKKIQIQKFGSRASRSEPDRGSSISSPNQNLGKIGTKYPGEDLPETGGNIIDLRKTNQ